MAKEQDLEILLLMGQAADGEQIQHHGKEPSEYKEDHYQLPPPLLYPDGVRRRLAIIGNSLGWQSVSAGADAISAHYG